MRQGGHNPICPIATASFIRVCPVISPNIPIHIYAVRASRLSLPGALGRR